jgi:putative phosphoesterase
MIDLIQHDSLVIGSKQAISELGKAKKARVLVISDSHRRPDIVNAIIEEFGSQSDALIFCGDGIGDIVQALEKTTKNTKFAKCFPDVLVMVEGNNDSDRYPVIFNPKTGKIIPGDLYEIHIPEDEYVKIAGLNIYVTHGHLDGVNYDTNALYLKMKNTTADIILYGHTHVSYRDERHSSIDIVNPGSCSLPRRNLPPSFALLEIPGNGERVTVNFYEMKITLEKGLTFSQFSPSVNP